MADPAVRGARDAPGRLPRSRTSFVGRGSELAQARHLLGHNRLLTLTGPGGWANALMKAGVRAFCMTAAGNYTRWQTLQLLAQKWDAIEEIANTDRPPFIYSVTNAGVRFLAR